MPKLAVLTKTIKRFSENPEISDEIFLNAFINTYVAAGNVRNKNGEELYLDKSATSLLLNQKSDVPQTLRKALWQYGIKEATEEGMRDFVEDYLNPVLISDLNACMEELIKDDNAINDEEKTKLLTLSQGDTSVLLTELLVLSLSECNRADQQRTIVWKNGTNIVEVISGDLFQFGFDNRKKNQRNIVVIPVNTAFDTQVTWKLEGNLNPIVSENTIHGQWLKRMEQCGTDMKDLDLRIAKSLRNWGSQPVSFEPDRNGKQDQYTIGSCALIETENAYYILLAVSEFDKINKAKSDPKMIDTAVKSLLQSYDKFGQGYDMYIPLIGTGRSRTGLSITGAYDLLKDCLIHNSDLIHGHIYLVLRPEERTEIKEEN